MHGQRVPFEGREKIEQEGEGRKWVQRALSSERRALRHIKQKKAEQKKKWKGPAVGSGA